MTLKEAAALAGVTDAALRLAIASGKLKAKKIGRDWRVTRANLDKWIAQRR